jgi:MYXO-CTERM domain-containing protein
MSVKVALGVLVVAALLLLPGVLRLVIDGRADYLVVGAAGLLGLGIALGRRHRRERDRS